MIGRVQGILREKKEDRILLEVGGISYEIFIPLAVKARLDKSLGQALSLIIYYYLQIDKSKAIPILIGFIDELERDFFELFITVSGIGPKAAVKAFDKPIPQIAKAIEEGNESFLVSLSGIGRQKAKQIIAHLQGKVGRFVLLPSVRQQKSEQAVDKEIIAEAKQVLRRLQYNNREIENMINKALQRSKNIESLEELLNEIYRVNK